MLFRSEFFAREQRPVEQQRIEQRTRFDLEMLYEMGFCKGIENYSRHFSGKKEGEPPPTLMDYLPDNAIMFIDESHVTVTQIGGMYKGDASRKQNLVDEAVVTAIEKKKRSRNPAAPFTTSTILDFLVYQMFKLLFCIVRRDY